MYKIFCSSRAQLILKLRDGQKLPHLALAINYQDRLTAFPYLGNTFILVPTFGLQNLTTHKYCTFKSQTYFK